MYIYIYVALISSVEETLNSVVLTVSATDPDQNSSLAYIILKDTIRAKTPQGSEFNSLSVFNYEVIFTFVVQNRCAVASLFIYLFPRCFMLYSKIFRLLFSTQHYGWRTLCSGQGNPQPSTGFCTSSHVWL